MIGIVAFSFGLSEEEPNEANRALAELVQDISSEIHCVVVAQWEIAKALRTTPAQCVVMHHSIAGKYLDSEEVMAQAAKLFRERGITEVLPIAQPFLHLAKCKTLVRKSGFTLVPYHPPHGIPFPKDSKQWWTRGPLQLLLYAVLQKFLGRRG